MDILKKINWKQPKYMLPLIIYFPLLFVGYFVIDLFHTEKAEIPDNSLTTTEYLNPVLPDAKMKGDGIGNKYESMVKSYGKIDDLTAMENIDRNNEEEKESYDSKYSDEERQTMKKKKNLTTPSIQTRSVNYSNPRKPRSSLRLRDNYKRVRKKVKKSRMVAA